MGQPTDATTIGVISPTVRVAVEDAYGAVCTASSYTVKVVLGTNPGGATLSGVTDASTYANGTDIGSATFGDLNVDAAGVGYVLVATLDGVSTVPAAASAAFKVTEVHPAWLHDGNMQSANSSGAAVGSDGRIYYLTTDGSFLFEAYSTTTHASVTLANPPTARRWVAIAPDANGRIYAIGGQDSSSNALATVERYTPATNTWTAVASMPTARFALGATLGLDGRIYALGGEPNGAVLETAAVEAYDPGTDQWITLPSLPTARRWLAAATGADGRIYAIAGIASNSTVGTVEAYTPATNSWATLPSLPTSCWSPAATRGSDGRIYALGGNGGFGDWATLAIVEAFDAGTGSWSRLPNLLHARVGLASTTGPDGRLYVFGGGDPFNNDVIAVEAYGGVFALTPDHGSASSTVTVSGASNFGPNATVSVYWGTTAGTLLTTATTDAHGNMSTASFSVPSGANTGSYTVTLVDDKTSYPVRATFTVP